MFPSKPMKKPVAYGSKLVRAQVGAAHGGQPDDYKKKKKICNILSIL